MTPTTQDGQLRPMSELSNYKIETGDPDPRGWTVVGPDGRIGHVVDLLVDTQAMKVRRLLVNAGEDARGGGSLVTIDLANVELRENAQQVFAHDRAEPYSASYSNHAVDAPAGDERLTRTEEELHIGKRAVSRGEARIGKHVETERLSEPVTRRREEVVIERRPVEAGARADEATIGDAEVRIPLMEEEVIVEKRPVVKEELVVGKRVVEERDIVETEVRKEQFDIEDTTPRGREVSDQTRRSS